MTGDRYETIENAPVKQALRLTPIEYLKTKAFNRAGKTGRENLFKNVLDRIYPVKSL